MVRTSAKNNDGDFGERSAWERANGPFTTAEEFDWELYDQGGGWKPKEAKVKPEHLRELFANRGLWREKAEAAKRLQTIAKVGRTAAYEALKITEGRYSDMLHLRDDGLIGLVE